MLRFANKSGVTSDQMVMAEFAVKYRDDFYLQLLWILVGAGVAIVAGIIGYMLGIG